MKRSFATIPVRSPADRSRLFRKEETLMKLFTGSLNRKALLTPWRSAITLAPRGTRRAFAPIFGMGVALLALPGSHTPLAAASPPPASGTITTVAGNGQAGFSGDGGPATK